MSKTMRAMTITGFGGPEVFQEVELPIPSPGKGQVLIRVKASSVNPVDTKIRSGMLEAIAPEAPTVLGCDVAGIVEKVGDGVADFTEGDLVYGCPVGVKGCGGALAEYVVADANCLALSPEGMDFATAAALPLVSITAWEGLYDRANVAPGSKVLVHGGTGGVGHIAVQLALCAGAVVYATVSSPQKAKVVESMGAIPILYPDVPVSAYVDKFTAGKGFDVVFDSVGGDNVARCFEAAAVSGTVVSISTRTTADLAPLHAKGLSLHVVFMLIPLLYGKGRERHGEILTELSALVESKKVKPLIHPERFTFAEVGKAHALLASGQAVGKIVLTAWD
jgi:NADPH:quinone reductase